MGILTIAPAELAGAHLLIELAGGPQSGKTLTALRLARGMAGPKGTIGFLDTEAARGRLYARQISGGFLHADLTPPFTAPRYRQAIVEFIERGVEVLIIDSLSHVWAGDGGVLDQADATGKEGLLKWRDPKRAYNRFVNFLLSVRLHIIMCSRARQPVIQEGGTLTTMPWEPIHDKRLKFEMTIFLPMLLDGTYETDRKRLKAPGDLRHLFTGDLLTEETGATIGDWVAGGEPVNPAHELLRGRAYDAAALGGEELSAFWKGLSEVERSAITPIGANLRSAAQAADEQAEQRREAGTEVASRNAGEDARADPFGRLLVVDSSDPPEKFAPALAELQRRLGQNSEPPAEGVATPARKEEPHRPEFPEIEPQKVKGSFDWPGFADAVLNGYREAPPADRQTFRASQSRYLALLRSANRRASTDLSMAMSDVDRDESAEV